MTQRRQTDWRHLSTGQLGRLGEYWAKIAFAQYGYDVYAPELDDKGIDFLVRTAPGHHIEVQVKSFRTLNYRFVTKNKLQPSPHRYLVLAYFNSGWAPELYLIPTTVWLTPNALFVSRDYEGKKSPPEWGISLSQTNLELLSPFEISTAVQTLADAIDVSRPIARESTGDSTTRAQPTPRGASPTIDALTSSRSTVEGLGPPPSPGIYAAFVKRELRLHGLTLPPDRPVYIGKADDLATRLLRKHLGARTTGSSTLRRTLGALLRVELNLIPVARGKRKHPRDATNFRFDDESEKRLSNWLRTNLDFGWCVVDGPIDTTERDTIAVAEPILNDDGWDNPFWTTIDDARDQCRRLAGKTLELRTP